MSRPLKILVFSTLYPNAAQPRHGIFVETRLRQLLATGEVEAKVIAPIPWFPFTSEKFGSYSEYARAPHREERHGIIIEHPRFVTVPKLGVNHAPNWLFKTGKKAIKKLLNQGYDFDLIDAHYFYPDGVAAVELGRYFNKPVVVTGRGTDINIFPTIPVPRAKIEKMVHRADGLVTVCQALKDVLQKEFGLADNRVNVLRNGVDTKLFYPEDREKARAELGIEGKTIVSVGNLIELKGHDLIISALKQHPELNLCIIGHGELKSALQQHAVDEGVSNRVRFVGIVKQDKLRSFYSAADALILGSSREGLANVLLESMACGNPVVATPVGGTPEVVTAPEAGVIVQERSAEGIAAAIKQLFDNYPKRTATTAFAKQFSWDETTNGQLALFRSILKLPTES